MNLEREQRSKTHRLNRQVPAAEYYFHESSVETRRNDYPPVESVQRTENGATYHHTDGIRLTGRLFLLHCITEHNIHELIVTEKGPLHLSTLVQLQLNRLLQVRPVR